MSRRVHIESHYLRAKFGHGIDYGYTSVPNILLDHSKELHIDDNIVMFIIRILWAQDTYKNKHIKDSDLKMMSSPRSMHRYRKALEAIKDEKGNHLVTVQPFYMTDSKTKKIIGAGTDYNFTALFDYILNKFYPSSQNGSMEIDPSSQDEKPSGQNGTTADQFGTAEPKNGDSSDKMSDINIIEGIEIKEYKNTQKNNYIDKLTSGDTTYYFYPDNIYLCKGNQKGRSMSPKQVYDMLPLEHMVNKTIEKLYGKK